MNEILSVAWLKPIVQLIRVGRPAEALAIADYFPNTIGRQLSQLAAELIHCGSLYAQSVAATRDQ
jgi:hypothetical protein